MRRPVFVIYDKQTEYVADKICENTYVNKKVFSLHSELTAPILLDIAQKCNSDYFYVIKSDTELDFPDFNFDFAPKEWDSKYVHVWNNSINVRLFSVDSVLANPTAYNDTSMTAGRIDIKNHLTRICAAPVFDIVFISFDEACADENFVSLKNLYPRAKRVHGVAGICEAHKAAAKLAETDMFYVVDADAEVVPSFKFNYEPHYLDRQSVHVWHSLNPVNDLEYGYGAIKLFPTQLLRKYVGSPVDFTTTVSTHFKVIPEVSNVTRFNTDPFAAWRSGFRECAKLSAKLIPNQNNTETRHRLSVWCSTGSDRLFGEFAIAGSIAGAAFGAAHANQPDIVGLINDFKWLESQFNS